MIDRATLESRLTEAYAAQHTLLMGGAVARVRDQNGEEIQYTPANRSALAGYIQGLERQLGRRGVGGPMQVFL